MTVPHPGPAPTPAPLPVPGLQRLRAEHAPALLAFERANRAFFAASVPDRGDAYFTGFADRHRALLAEQAAGTIAFHLLVGEDGEVLGRFNLVDIADGSAEVGYRLAEKAGGRGLATAAVRALCSLAETRYALHTLRAATTRDNLASRKVLARTGFLTTGTADFDGRPGLTYVRTRPERPEPGAPRA
ncbi:GNAT family N-acetyltransferase [Streptomyces sp. NPDC091272]|uniref:GNAT family N-acetyltransferase n=1 Tax=Streptomyces sp. NPDC091272 TaxID=3365981 RepID=UPI0038302503